MGQEEISLNIANGMYRTQYREQCGLLWAHQ